MNDAGEPLRVAVLVNRRAVRGRRRRSLVRRLAHRPWAQTAAVALDLLETRSRTEGSAAAEAAARAGAGAVVAVGGDGTVQSVVTGLLRLGASAQDRPALLIAPHGRGNDLARSLGIPRDILALQQALRGQNERLLDVGRARVDEHERIFVNALGIGLDAAIARRARRVPLLRAGAYRMATLGAVMRERGPWHLKGVLDEKPLDREATLLSLGNGATTGGGFQLTPLARPDDGILDYCLILERSPRRLLGLMPRVARGEHVGDPAVEVGRLRHLQVTIDPPACVHGDGEVFSRAAHTVRVDLEASALRVRLPP